MVFDDVDDVTFENKSEKKRKKKKNFNIIINNE